MQRRKALVLFWSAAGTGGTENGYDTDHRYG